MWRKAAVPITLFVVSMLAFLINDRNMGSGDTLPARFLPFSILLEGDLDLDEFEWLHDKEALKGFPLMEGVPYYLRRPGKSYYSAYPVGAALLALPVYLVPVLAGVEPTDQIGVERLGKISAALIAAFSALFLLFALQRVTTPAWALILALIYSLATATLSTSAQALWQHGPSQLFLALMLWFLVRADADDRFAPFACLALSAAIAMRAPNGVVALPVAYLMITRHRRRLLWCALAFVPPLALNAAYCQAIFGSFAPSLTDVTWPVTSGFSQIPLFEGLYGVLLSPARGLFFFSPVLLLSIGGAAVAIARDDRLTGAVAVAALLLIGVAGKWFMWWGGHCWGPRLLADISPLMVFLLHPLTGLRRRRTALRVTLAVLAVLSSCFHLLGAFKHDGRFDAAAETDLEYGSMLHPGNSPIFFYTAELLGLDYQVTSTKADGRELAEPGRLDDIGSFAVFEAPYYPERDSPEVVLSTSAKSYAAGETLEITVDSTNPHRPMAVNAYVAIRPSQTMLDFYDGRVLSPPVKGEWPAWVRTVPLPYRMTATFRLDMSGWEDSLYKVYYILTDAQRSRVLARKSVLFTLGKGAR